jgi:outer membrane protein OmpA-like peptidoglycan-associated protein
MQLSKNRVESVKAHLTSRNVTAQRLQAVGAGPDHPVSIMRRPRGARRNAADTIVPEEEALQGAKG